MISIIHEEYTFDSHFRIHYDTFMKERRSHFLINRPLQLRYMAYITLTLLTVVLLVGTNLYFGIWGGILDAFSNESIRNDLLTASRLTQYEEARITNATPSPEPLAYFKQAEKLSQRQREIFKEILNETNRKLLPKFLLLVFLLAWGTIYLSHRIAGPIYRVHRSLEEIGRGNLQIRIFLRKYDEAQFLSAGFNEALEKLDASLSRVKTIMRENESNPSRMVEDLKKELSNIKTSADR